MPLPLIKTFKCCVNSQVSTPHQVFYTERSFTVTAFFSPHYPPSKLRIQVGLQLSVTFQGIFHFQLDNLSHFRSSFSFSFWVSLTSPCSLIRGLVWVCFGSYLFSLIIWVCFESISSLILVSFDSHLTLFWVLWVYLESQLSLFESFLSLFWVSFGSLLSLLWVSLHFQWVVLVNFFLFLLFLRSSSGLFNFHLSLLRAFWVILKD